MLKLVVRKARLRLSNVNLILLMWRIWRAPNNARKWHMEFNSAFKGLKLIYKVKIRQVEETREKLVITFSRNWNLKGIKLQNKIFLVFLVKAKSHYKSKCMCGGKRKLIF
jgi:hypothetical protein